MFGIYFTKLVICIYIPIIFASCLLSVAENCAHTQTYTILLTTSNVKDMELFSVVLIGTGTRTETTGEIVKAVFVL